ncbi:MAG: cysteine hydrolase [Oscillospiraceae bacterium]|nr:MAG: cysteine hydrolase [Oscillospiraceae bacterium]
MKTLIVIDMQNDFVTGVLGSKEAVAVLPNVKKKIDAYIAAGDEVIFTRDTHGENYLETNEGRYLPVPHCVKGTEGWQVVKEIDCPDCKHIDKPTFGYIHWSEQFKDSRISGIEIIGVCTDICVISNALILKAVFPEIDISVDASCCAGVTPETHRAALTAMKACQIRVIGE